MKVRRKKDKTIHPSEKSIQPGCIIRIKQEPPGARITGFTFGSEHVIQIPPENGINSQAGVWLHDKRKRLKYLHFPYWKTTGKKRE